MRIILWRTGNKGANQNVTKKDENIVGLVKPVEALPTFGINTCKNKQENKV